MDFDRLLEQYDAEGQKEIVGLAIYYIENFEGKSGATPSEVGALLKTSRSSVSKSSVSTYLTRLDDWVTNTANGGSQLTHTGEEHVERALDDALFDEPRRD